MRIVIVGATGFIGRALVETLRERGDSVTAVTRNPDRARRTLGHDVPLMRWNPPELGDWTSAFDAADGIVNLAGASVAGKRWTAARKREILDSRLVATAAVVQAIGAANPRPTVLVNASAVGFYGSRGDEVLTESSAPGEDFLSGVTRQWEAAALEAQKLGVRVVMIRSGIVLGRQGGALAQMAMPFRIFVGGTMGRPDQWVPWIHIDDEVALIIYALTHDTMKGPVNATAPNPVHMEEFSRQIGQSLRRPSWVPMLSLFLPLALGQRAEVLLSSERALPESATDAGYQFQHTDSAEALRSLLG